MKGRPRDPKREQRRTGHRRKPGEAPKLAIAPDPRSTEILTGFDPPESLPEEMIPHMGTDRAAARAQPVAR